MQPANIIAAAMCVIVAVFMATIALWAFKRKDPMHFWTGSTIDPKDISDIPAYNRANGLMWLVYSGLFIISAVISLINITAGGISIAVISTLGIIPLIIGFKKITKKYKTTS